MYESVNGELKFEFHVFLCFAMNHKINQEHASVTKLKLY